MRSQSNARVRAFAPATIANLGCGFDIFGLALESPGDEVTVELSEQPGVTMATIEGDDGRLPKDPERNTAGVAVRGLLAHLDREDVGIAVHLRKGLPSGSGLGSSAASSVAAVLAANVLLGEPLERRELLPFTMEAERVACGSPHGDNVAPALLGGFVLIRSDDPLDLVEIPTPPELWCALVRPHVEVRTEAARRVLPDRIPVGMATRQWANTAALVAGMLKSDYDLIGRSLEDVFAEPHRARLVPAFKSVQSAAREAGSLGGSFAGSGPSVFSLCRGEASARRVGMAMCGAFKAAGLECDEYFSRINPSGAQILPVDEIP